MAVKKSIAIIGEGETEWWYFETLRVVCLVDMDRLIMVPAEMATYQKMKKKSSRDTKVPVTFVSGTNNICIFNVKTEKSEKKFGR